MSSAWCAIECMMRSPVSAVLRERRITSTRARAGARPFSASSLRTSGKATPGARTSSSRSRWYFQ